MNEKEKFFKEFNDGLHRIGRITLILAVALLVAIPFVIGFQSQNEPRTASGYASLILLKSEGNGEFTS